MIPPASLEGGDRRIILETVFKVDKRGGGEGRGGEKFDRQKWSPQQVWREVTDRSS